ncbi:hypothetical protein H2199_006214 [Coniosporium tulheliwenetii]|uniref:Uncharacterized protein n=1 Tax=Coniosporium tulheliwenetii TaxID=3383036 RepID=A0ACC2YXS4_9PEZI|nr:hypothetical protein H2199_006214 [Cladosporium sp. JES 115]
MSRKMFAFLFSLLSFLFLATITSCDEQSQRAIALMRRPRSLVHLPVLSKRDMPHDMWEGLFEPTTSVTLDYIEEDYEVTQRSVYTLVLSHNSSRYVDLEQLEFLLTPQERICSPLARNDESTRVTLPFLELDAYHTARRTWESRSDMLFVIEDESCFNGKGVRSMYKSRSLTFVEESQTVIIDSMPVRNTSADWVSHLRSLNLAAVNLPNDVVLQLRLPRRANRLPRRNFVERGWDEVKQKGHDVKEAAENSGKHVWDTGKDVGKNAKDSEWKEIPGTVNDGYENVKDDWRNVELGPEVNNSFPYSVHHNFGDRKFVAGRVGALTFVPMPNIFCVKCWIHLDAMIYYDFEFDIIPLNADGENRHGVERFLKKAKAGFRAMKPVDIRLQLEVLNDVSLDVFCHIPIPGLAVVAPGDTICSPGYTVNSVLFDGEFTPKAKDNKAGGNKKGIEVYGTGGGLFIFFNVGATGTLNLTLPGMRWTMDEGASAEIDLLAPDSLDVDLPISGKANSPGVPEWAQPGFMAALDLARMQAEIDEPQGVDAKCYPGGPYEHSIGLRIFFRAGFWATITVGKMNFDTNRLLEMKLDNLGYSTNPKLLKAAPLNIFVPIWQRCWPVTKGVAGRINEWFQKMVDLAWPGNLVIPLGGNNKRPSRRRATIYPP